MRISSKVLVSKLLVSVLLNVSPDFFILFLPLIQAMG